MMERKRLTREESRQQTRERLLDAAMQVFSQRGFYAASLDEIAEAAGYSKGAVYSNFASKEELFLGLFDRRTAQDAQQWGGIANVIAPPTEENRQGEVQQDESDDFLKVVQSRRTWILLQMEFLLYALRDESVRPKVAERLVAMRAGIKTHLVAAYAQYNVKPTLPIENLPLYLFSLDIGLVLQALVDPQAIPDDPYAPVLRYLLH